MTLKVLRNEKRVSQIQLAEETGIGLRTIQRIETGERVRSKTLRVLAEHLDCSPDELYEQPNLVKKHSLKERVGSELTHRSVQIIMLFATYFICVTHWLDYLYKVRGEVANENLGTVLLYVFLIASTFSLFGYIFYQAKKLLLFSYYVTFGSFCLIALVCAYLFNSLGTSNDLFFPAYFTLMLASLFAIHVIQLALSLKGEIYVVALAPSKHG